MSFVCLILSNIKVVGGDRKPKGRFVNYHPEKGINKQVSVV